MYPFKNYKIINFLTRTDAWHIHTVYEQLQNKVNSTKNTYTLY